MKQKSFSIQLVIIGSFGLFFYMFFALATSIYRDFKLQSQIDRFEEEVNGLAEMTHEKPEDVAYFSSEEYKDRYAKENLNLLNPGEKLIVIPKEDLVVEKGPVQIMTDKVTPNAVLNLPHRYQWWEYFFGQHPFS